MKVNIPESTKYSGLRSVIYIIMVVAGLTVIGVFAWMARHDIKDIEDSISWRMMSLASVIGVLTSICYGWTFILLNRKLGVSVPFGKLLGIFLISQSGKYLPGKVWPALMQSNALGKDGRLLLIGITNIEFMLIIVLHMAILGAFCFLATKALIIALALVSFGLLLSSWLMILPSNFVLNWLPKRLTKNLPDRVPHRYEARLRPTISLLVGGMCLLLNLLGSWYMLGSLGELIPSSARLGILSALYLGFASSMLAIPVPAGIGVREAAAVGVGLVVAPGTPVAVLVSAALLARLWQVFVDAGSVGAGIAILHLRSLRS